MSLHAYDPRLLEMMYQLTKHQKFMTSKEIANTITIKGKKVSERTIKRWFKWLKSRHYFTYYPSVRYDQLGLVSTTTILEGVKDDLILDVIPYKIYLMKGTNILTLQDCFFVDYMIPYNSLRDFKCFWEIAKKKNLIKNYKIIPAEQIIACYAPCHLIVDKNGNLDFESCTLKDNHFLDLIQNKIKEKRETVMHETIRQNPYLVPLILEYFKDHQSSVQVWRNLKRKLSDRVWDYFKDSKLKRKKNDGSAIVKIQKGLKYLHQNFDTFFQQMRIAYGPLYARKQNLNICMVLQTKSKANIVALAQKLQKNSLYIVKQISKKYVCIDLVTSGDKLGAILRDVGEHAKKQEILVHLDYQSSTKYWQTDSWLKLKYNELFDPKTASWRFETSKYIKQLKTLSPDKR